LKPTRQELRIAGKARRDAWMDGQKQFCWVCGTMFRLCVHHIMERLGSPERWDQTPNFFVICDDCHTSEFHDTADADQLCRKKMHDPEHYDRLAWNLSRDERAPEFVTTAEVAAATQRIFGGAI
jgi:hypothetical protein